MLHFDGSRFTAGELSASLDEVAWVRFNEVYVQFKGLAMLFQPFLGGEQGFIEIALKDGRQVKERLRGPQETTTARQLAAAASIAAGAHDLERLEAGQTVDYGPVKLSATGVTAGRKTLRWDEIGGYRVFQGALMFDRGHHLAATIPTRKLLNPFALLKVLEHELPGRDYERMEPGRRPSGSILAPTASWHDPRYLSGRARLMILGAPLLLIPIYMLAAVPFALSRHDAITAAQASNAEIVSRAQGSWPDASAPMPASLSDACPPETFSPESVLTFVRLQSGDELYAEADDEYVYASRVPRPWPISIVDSYSRILFEAPTDWGRASREILPYRDWSRAERLLIASEVSYVSDTDYDSPGFGTTSLNARLVHGGETVCEGHVHADLLSGPLAGRDNGVPRAVVQALCPRIGASVCTELARFVSPR